jgi:hypothetical protein
VVVAPRWVKALLPLRELLARGMERQVIKLMPEVEALAQAERERVGNEAASMPVGPGGAAAARAAGHDPAATPASAGVPEAASTPGGAAETPAGDPVAPAG